MARRRVVAKLHRGRRLFEQAMEEEEFVDAPTREGVGSELGQWFFEMAEWFISSYGETGGEVLDCSDLGGLWWEEGERIRAEDIPELSVPEGEDLGTMLIEYRVPERFRMNLREYVRQLEEGMKDFWDAIEAPRQRRRAPFMVPDYDAVGAVVAAPEAGTVWEGAPQETWDSFVRMWPGTYRLVHAVMLGRRAQDAARWYSDPGAGLDPNAGRLERSYHFVLGVDGSGVPTSDAEMFFPPATGLRASEVGYETEMKNGRAISGPIFAAMGQLRCENVSRVPATERSGQGRLRYEKLVLEGSGGEAPGVGMFTREGRGSDAGSDAGSGSGRLLWARAEV